MHSPADALSADYHRNVFINCPFDADFQPLFRALVFAVYKCGMRARCALEVYDSAQVRIDKIGRIIESCRWGIHDLSRTELTSGGLPRFNMPLELGLFLGAQRFGSELQRTKNCLVLDHSPHRYLQFISDLRGQDIEAHANDPNQAIGAVRDWLHTACPEVRPLPGRSAMVTRYQTFAAELPALCSAADLQPNELTFVDFADLAATWLAQDHGPNAGS